MAARQPAVRSLPFQHNHKPALGFEMFKLSSLYERANRKILGHALETPQRPEFHTLYFGTQGRGEMLIDFTPVPIAVDTLTVVARGRIQQFIPRPGVDAWMLLFTPAFVEVLGEADPLAMPAILWPLDAVPQIQLPPADLAAVVDTIAQLEVEHARQLDAFQPLILAGLLRTLLLRCERTIAWASPNGTLRRFFTILERDHCRTREVAHYAKETGVSPRRLGELMHAELGRSTKEVIDERVILEHKRLLFHDQIAVKELAARTGFAEPTNLVKFFRHHTGQTPLEFRESARTEDRRISPSRRRS